MIDIEYVEGPYGVNSESGWVEEVGYAVNVRTGELGVVVIFRPGVGCFYPNTPQAWVDSIAAIGGREVHSTVYGMHYEYVRL